jgi:hypothetical protein
MAETMVHDRPEAKNMISAASSSVSLAGSATAMPLSYV